MTDLYRLADKVEAMKHDVWTALIKDPHAKEWAMASIEDCARLIREQAKSGTNTINTFQTISVGPSYTPASAFDGVILCYHAEGQTFQVILTPEAAKGIAKQLELLADMMEARK